MPTVWGRWARDAAMERLDFRSAGIGRGPDTHPVCFSRLM